MRRLAFLLLAVSLCLSQQSSAFWQSRGSNYNNFIPAAGSSVIKTIQQCSITMAASAGTGTCTLGTAITVANSILIWGGRNTNAANQTTPATETARIAITNTTTITATRGVSTTHNLTVDFTVVEFASGVNSIQAGTITIANPSTSSTTGGTISAVGANAFVLWQGASSTSAVSTWSPLSTAVTLTNSTTVTALQGVTLGVTTTVGYMVVDLDSTIVNAIQQRVVTSAAASATDTDAVSAVTTGNTLLMFGGVTSADAGTDVSKFEYTNVLTTSTLVTMTRSSAISTSSRTHYYTAVQFAAGALNGSVQRGVVVLAAAASGTGTITAITLAKSFVNWGGILAAGNNANVVQSVLTLQDATASTPTVTLNAAGTMTTSYEVIQFN